jgi:hypothetical protein
MGVPEQYQLTPPLIWAAASIAKTRTKQFFIRSISYPEIKSTFPDSIFSNLVLMSIGGTNLYLA